MSDLERTTIDVHHLTGDQLPGINPMELNQQLLKEITPKIPAAHHSKPHETIKDGNITIKADYATGTDKLTAVSATIKNRDHSSVSVQWSDEWHLQQIKMQRADRSSNTLDYAQSGNADYLAKDTVVKDGTVQTQELRPNGTLIHEHSQWSGGGEDDITYDANGNLSSERQTDKSGHVTLLDYSRRPST